MFLDTCLNIRHCGWKYLYTQIFPVYHTQDINFFNKGYDILSIRMPNHPYFYGNWDKWNKYVMSEA